MMKFACKATVLAMVFTASTLSLAEETSYHFQERLQAM